MFTKSQQDLLKSVARHQNHPEFGKINEQLNIVIQDLRKQSPRAFLRDVDLQERVFMHEPKSNIQLKEFVKPLQENQ